MISKISKLNIGSDWGKWDLHVHTPNTKLSDNFKSVEEIDLWDKFCESLQKSDVEVVGIADYFSAENYFTFIEKFKAKYPQSKKKFFLNLELRLEVSVNKSAEEVNLHIVFSDKTCKDKIESFLSKLDTNISKNGACVSCKDISTKADCESAGIDYKILRKKLKEIFGDDECYLIFGAATLTEWRAAYLNSQNYFFVICQENGDEFHFTEYSPEEFEQFSTIPPFKIFFNIPLDKGAKVKSKRNNKTAIQLTKDRLSRLDQIFQEFKND